MSASSHKLASRSAHGCWTCRLRKKKCDENHPACSRCTSLGITCDGYGPRPFWMDRGDLQRQQARYVARFITQTKEAARKSELLPNVAVPTVASDDHLVPFNLEPVPVPVPMMEPPTPPPSLQGLQIVFGSQDGGGGGNMPAVAPGESMWSDDLFYVQQQQQQQPQQQQPPYGPSPPPSDAAESLTTPSIARATEAARADSSSSSSPRVSTYAMSRHSSDHPMMGGCYSSDNLSGCGSGGEVDLPGRPSHHTSSLPSSGGLSTTTPILHGELDDILLMYYFDHVFYLYWPFYYASAKRQARGWLFSTLKRARSARHAALALSECHYGHPTTPLHGRARPVVDLGRRHYERALQEMQASLVRSATGHRHRDLRHDVELLTTILHLLFYESATGCNHDWQIHLGGASTMLHALMQTQLGLRAARPDPVDATPAPPSPNAVTFLLGLFVHIHVVICASTRANSFALADHRALLEAGAVDLAALTGCSNWVMVFLVEISSLDRWKTEAQDARRLSLLELTAYGRQIEVRLRSRLTSMENNDVGVPPPRTDASPLPQQTAITAIFAHAALVYLHVVISGAYPDIPDIKTSVAATMNALHALPDPALIRYVAWPYCVAGCLAADDEHQRRFREMVAGVAHNSCLKARDLMEACWRLRQTEPGSHDWASVMKRQGTYVLLI